ncbi:putative sucrose phosphorylase [Trabulsiella guamensis ATCC 49490]|uniref:Putative sucrose phosphorylase n=2 Tax=Trabulsiella guamensis TaxID=158852 RepID=A0A085AI28_9ENTR|nr:putative sucrose phosphorylase [Trabulsiella guamensis ATCC 49490]
MRAKINDLIRGVYGNTFSATHFKILQQQIDDAQSLNLSARKKEWDESDVVLITYADQFFDSQGKGIPALTRFFNRWLGAFFSHTHLLPFYPWSSDDGFSVVDYHSVDPEMGTWHDIANLKKSTKLMFDFVCNHMSAKSKWFANYLQQQTGYEDFFIAVDPSTDLSAVTRPRALPLLTPFTLHTGEVRYLWTTFSEDQIDLNFASPNVFIAMVDVLLRYLKEGADYIRLDAVGFMWKTPGTSCLHLEKTHQLIQIFRAIVDVVAPGTVIITETNVPHKDNIAYYGNGYNEAQMVYQFSLPPLILHAMHCGNVQTLCHWAQGLKLPSKKTTWFNFLASHDGIGLNPLRGLLPEQDILDLVDTLQSEGALISWKNNPDGTRSPYEVNVTYLDALSQKNDGNEQIIAKFILAHALLLTFPGVPAIYIQSLLGSRNDHEAVKRLGYNRAINRTKLNSEEIAHELEASAHLRHAIYNEMVKLITLRRQHKVFHPDAEAIFECPNDSVLKINRVTDEGERLTALFNFSSSCCNLDSEIKCGRDIITDTLIHKKTLTLQPWQVMWITEN